MLNRWFAGPRSQTSGNGGDGEDSPVKEADFIVLNPGAMPLLARKVAHAASLDELLFAMIVLGDDRIVERTAIANLQ